MLAGARLPMKQRKTAHSSANKLGGLLSSGLGRGGETSGITMSVDSGEGETGDKVSPSGGRCHSSDRQVWPPSLLLPARALYWQQGVPQ